MTKTDAVFDAGGSGAWAPADPAGFRAAFRRHAQGVTIVTTVDQFGHHWGMTATAVTSVSLDPPLLLVCLDSRSGLVGPMRSGAGFVVHLLSAQQDELARRFATPLDDKFEGVPYGFSRNGCARLRGALASLECVPHAVHPSGDHTIFIGRVVEIAAGGTECDDALVFYAGELKRLGPEGDGS